MRDILLEMVFDPARWSELLEHAAEKGINKGELRLLSTPDKRAELYLRIIDNSLEFQVPHQANIPKDEPGEYRTVYVGETVERVLCSIINDCLFELFARRVHKTCTSYQKGMGTGKVVTALSKVMGLIKGYIIGAKYDFHHYFDTVLKQAIFDLFDSMERELGFEQGTEPIFNLLRRMYNNDLLFDVDNNLISQWSGIRQGNAVASFLADAILYELDEFMSKKYMTYVRYSDDLIVLGGNVDEITDDINRIVGKYGVSLNPKKVQPIKRDEYVKFLGFSLRGSDITISKGRLETFVNEIRSRTIDANGGRGNDFATALRLVINYLYKGDGKHSWSTSMLGVITNDHDVRLMNFYVMDCLKACITGKHKNFPSLGYKVDGKDGVVDYPRQGNIGANKKKVGKIPGYESLVKMRDALITDRDAYDVKVMEM